MRNPIKNAGAGAAMMRIEAARRVFPRCWFNESKTEAGRDALGYYHERQDEKRSIGLGPEHDWSSRAADAFGYMAISYEEPPVKSAVIRRPVAASRRHTLEYVTMKDGAKHMTNPEWRCIKGLRNMETYCAGYSGSQKGTVLQ